MQPLKNREDLIGVLHIHVDAVIFYGKLPRVPSSIELRINLYLRRLLISELDRIAEEVLEELDELCLITYDPRQRLPWQLNPNPALL